MVAHDGTVIEPAYALGSRHAGQYCSLSKIRAAFATRTASILARCFFGSGVFFSSPMVGAMAGSWFGAVELCSIGCTLIGPVDGDLLLAIRDNSLLASSFDGSLKGALPAKTSRLPLGNPAKLEPAQNKRRFFWN
jgi:hypothetical protein